MLPRGAGGQSAEVAVDMRLASRITGAEHGGAARLLPFQVGAPFQQVELTSAVVQSNGLAMGFPVADVAPAPQAFASREGDVPFYPTQLPSEPTHNVWPSFVASILHLVIFIFYFLSTISWYQLKQQTVVKALIYDKKPEAYLNYFSNPELVKKSSNWTVHWNEEEKLNYEKETRTKVDVGEKETGKYEEDGNAISLKDVTATVTYDDMHTVTVRVQALVNRRLHFEAEIFSEKCEMSLPLRALEHWCAPHFGVEREACMRTIDKLETLTHVFGAGFFFGIIFHSAALFLGGIAYLRCCGQFESRRGRTVTRVFLQLSLCLSFLTLAIVLLLILWYTTSFDLDPSDVSGPQGVMWNFKTNSLEIACQEREGKQSFLVVVPDEKLPRPQLKEGRGDGFWITVALAFLHVITISFSLLGIGRMRRLGTWR